MKIRKKKEKFKAEDEITNDDIDDDTPIINKKKKIIKKEEITDEENNENLNEENGEDISPDEEIPDLSELVDKELEEKNPDIEMIELYKKLIDELMDVSPEKLEILGDLHDFQQLERYELLTYIYKTMPMDWLGEVRTMQLKKMFTFKYQRSGNMRDRFIRILDTLITSNKNLSQSEDNKPSFFDKFKMLRG